MQTNNTIIAIRDKRMLTKLSLMCKQLPHDSTTVILYGNKAHYSCSKRHLKYWTNSFLGGWWLIPKMACVLTHTICLFRREFMVQSLNLKWTPFRKYNCLVSNSKHCFAFLFVKVFLDFSASRSEKNLGQEKACQEPGCHGNRGIIHVKRLLINTSW